MKQSLAPMLCILGIRSSLLKDGSLGGGRTHTPKMETDFKSVASAIPPRGLMIVQAPF